MSILYLYLWQVLYPKSYCNFVWINRTQINEWMNEKWDCSFQSITAVVDSTRAVQQMFKKEHLFSTILWQVVL
jgi:hypothetical protein